MLPGSGYHRLLVKDRANLPRGHINGHGYSCEARCGYDDEASNLIMCESTYHETQGKLTLEDGTRCDRGWYHRPCAQVAPDEDPDHWLCPSCIRNGRTTLSKQANGGGSDDDGGDQEDRPTADTEDNTEDEFQPGDDESDDNDDEDDEDDYQDSKRSHGMGKGKTGRREQPEESQHTQDESEADQDDYQQSMRSHGMGKGKTGRREQPEESQRTQDESEADQDDYQDSMRSHGKGKGKTGRREQPDISERTQDEFEADDYYQQSKNSGSKGKNIMRDLADESEIDEDESEAYLDKMRPLSTISLEGSRKRKQYILSSDDESDDEATKPAPKTSRGKFWIEEEKVLTMDLMHKIKAENKVFGEKRFEEVSKGLKQEGYEREWTSVKNAWNRGLRERSGFDERRNKNGPLTTSKQDSETKRRNQELKAQGRRSATTESAGTSRARLQSVSPKRGFASDEEDEVMPTKRRRASP